MVVAGLRISSVFRVARHFGAAALAVSLLALPAPAEAALLVGKKFSLGDLMEGGSFGSRDKKLEFSAFSALVDGKPIANPEAYRVKVMKNGFKLESVKTGKGKGRDATANLVLRYAVETKGQKAIDEIHLGYKSKYKGKTPLGENGIWMSVLDRGASEIAHVKALRAGGSKKSTTGSSHLSPPLAKLWMEEKISLLPGLKSALKSEHKFIVGSRTPLRAVPEPGTGLLLGGGLIALAIRERARRR